MSQRPGMRYIPLASTTVPPLGAAARPTLTMRLPRMTTVASGVVPPVTVSITVACVRVIVCAPAPPGDEHERHEQQLRECAHGYPPGSKACAMRLVAAVRLETWMDWSVSKQVMPLLRLAGLLPGFHRERHPRSSPSRHGQPNVRVSRLVGSFPELVRPGALAAAGTWRLEQRPVLASKASWP